MADYSEYKFTTNVYKSHKTEYGFFYHNHHIVRLYTKFTKHIFLSATDGHLTYNYFC